jgi:pimeloyl-ACP methyl ester carboxylesterase
MNRRIQFIAWLREDDCEVPRVDWFEIVDETKVTINVRIADPETISMPTLMTPRDYLALPIMAGDVKSAYGEDAQQFGELFLPVGERVKPAPVVVLLHGGCWQHAFGLAPLGQLARGLNGLGLAVWNLEFRRLGGGGGWPATFLDVANGVQHLRTLAVEHDLDIERLILAGHSAGGHLALWLAGRWRLPKDCEINPPHTLAPRAVVSLAGIGDLESALHSGICRGAPGALVDGELDARPERYAQASPPGAGAPDSRPGLR